MDEIQSACTPAKIRLTSKPRRVSRTAMTVITTRRRKKSSYLVYQLKATVALRLCQSQLLPGFVAFALFCVQPTAR